MGVQAELDVRVGDLKLLRVPQEPLEVTEPLGFFARTRADPAVLPLPCPKGCLCRRLVDDRRRGDRATATVRDDTVPALRQRVNSAVSPDRAALWEDVAGQLNLPRSNDVDVPELDLAAELLTSRQEKRAAAAVALARIPRERAEALVP